MADKGGMAWETFPHEADVGVRGYGDTLAEAFAGAATALTAAICDPDKVCAAGTTPAKVGADEATALQGGRAKDALLAVADDETVRIECAAPDHELLLVDWLNALIYEMATRHLLFARFEVDIEGGRLTAFARGEPVDAARHQPAAEVKGATFCELAVRKLADGRWLAQCVVDV